MRPTTYRKYSAADVQYMRDHIYDGPKEVSKALGASKGTVAEYLRRLQRGTFKTKEYPTRKYYALYLRKTDELVCCGTAQECADALGIQKHSFYVLAHKALHGKVKKWDVYIEDIDVEEDDEWV